MCSKTFHQISHCVHNGSALFIGAMFKQNEEMTKLCNMVDNLKINFIKRISLECTVRCWMPTINES
jgi:hypothetical protein